MRGMNESDLKELDDLVVSALQRRDNSQLSILGFGEVSVALGFPADAPRLVCKRTPPMPRQHFDDYQSLVDRYVAELRSAGLTVIDTTVQAVERDGAVAGYLVQPLLPAATLGHNVLAAAEPDPDHEFLVALGQTLEVVSDRLSIDAQVTNWSWDGSTLTLIDVGTPFMWDQSGALQLDLKPYTPMISAPLRGVVMKDLTKMIDRWRAPRGVAVDVVANLYREGLDVWVEPMITALNRRLGDGVTPVVADEARAIYDEDLKTWPRLNKLKKLERAWQTGVRRRPYDFFIQTTYGDDSI